MGDNVYKPRIVETVLKSALNREGAVLVEGTKSCGKTTTCAKYSQSGVTLDNAYVFNIAENNPEALLTGPFPRMIDEWQLVCPRSGTLCATMLIIILNWEDLF